jgi:hypothetical protein
MDIHPDAYHAIRAAKMLPFIGRHAAVRYCQVRKVPLHLLTLARILQIAPDTPTVDLQGCGGISVSFWESNAP